LYQATEAQERQCCELIGTLNQKRLHEFILEVNRDITKFNQLIEQYHRAETLELKTTILQEMNERHTAMDARYPESVIRRSEEYRTRFYDGLATEIRRNTEQIAALDAGVPGISYPTMTLLCNI